MEKNYERFKFHEEYLLVATEYDLRKGFRISKLY